MQTNSVSFGGLWGKAQQVKEIGKDPTCKNGRIYSEVYTYYPFKDEATDNILETVDQYNGKIIAFNDQSDDDAYGPEAYFMPQIIIGNRLNITEQDYQDTKKLNEAIFDDTQMSTFNTLSGKDEQKIKSYIA